MLAQKDRPTNKKKNTFNDIPKMPVPSEPFSRCTIVSVFLQKKNDDAIKKRKESFYELVFGGFSLTILDVWHHGAYRDRIPLVWLFACLAHCLRFRSSVYCRYLSWNIERSFNKKFIESLAKCDHLPPSMVVHKCFVIVSIHANLWFGHRELIGNTNRCMLLPLYAFTHVNTRYFFTARFCFLIYTLNTHDLNTRTNGTVISSSLAWFWYLYRNQCHPYLVIVKPVSIQYIHWLSEVYVHFWWLLFTHKSTVTIRHIVFHLYLFSYIDHVQIDFWFIPSHRDNDAAKKISEIIMKV